MPSTQSLEAMRRPDALARLCQSLAVLDAAICPEWDDRYYSFNARWDEGEQLASMSNGSGDEWRAHFTQRGVILFGLDHESEAYRHGDPYLEILSNVPECFRASVAEPAFDTANISFCLWCEGSRSWQTGPIESLGHDGSAELLRVLDFDPETYRTFASEYYEVELDQRDIQHVYSHKPLTTDILQRLNRDRRIDDLRECLDEIGYPVEE